MNQLKVGQEEYSPTNPEGISCDSCGVKFEKPLFTTMSSGQVLKEYYACPKCLSKIISVDVQKQKEEINPEWMAVEEPKIDQPKIDQPKIDQPKIDQPKIDQPKVEQNKSSIPGCQNTIGYLKRRPKNAPIPEECFTCSKMIDCMAY